MYGSSRARYDPTEDLILAFYITPFPERVDPIISPGSNPSNHVHVSRLAAISPQLAYVHYVDDPWSEQ